MFEALDDNANYQKSCAAEKGNSPRHHFMKTLPLISEVFFPNKACKDYKNNDQAEHHH